MSVRVVDLSGDPREAQFHYFLSYANPYAAVTAPVSVGELVRWCEERREGFFLPFLYCAARAANTVPELRRRIRGEQVVEYDWCPTSHTVALPNGSYCYCQLRADTPFPAFLPYAKSAQEAARREPVLEDGETAESLLFVSCLPWLSYSAILQPTPAPADSNPRITCGKYTPQGREFFLPVTLQVHHALADGIHIARFYQALEAELAALCRG